MISLPLQRSDRPIDSFLSALGRVRETRLTATLAYLISRFPNEFLPLVGGSAKDDYYVSVEETDEGDRYDVLVKGGKIPIILEGKTGIYQNQRQLLRYVRTVRKKYKRRPDLVIVDVGSHKSQGLSEEIHKLKQEVFHLRFTTWTKVAEVCKQITVHKKPFRQDRIAAAIAEDLLTHLEENLMITNERPEIYLRDVSTRDSVDLYFRHRIYKCQSQFLRSAQNNLYFAPYFTKATAKSLSNDNLVPVGEGVSFISKINEVRVLPTKKVMEFLKTQKIDNPKEAAELIRERHRAKDVLLLLLGKPHLLFLSPVTKGKLARVNTNKKFTVGAMGSRSCSLEELLAASQV